LEIDYTFREQETRAMNGNRNYLLTCIDRFSRYAWVVARADKTAQGTTNAFKKIAEGFRTLTGEYPHTIFSDQGKEFDNRIFRAYVNSKGIRQRLTQPFTPASTIERFNGSLRHAVDTFLHMYKSQRYIDYLPRFTRSYNTHVHRSPGQAPTTLRQKPELWAAAVKR